MDLKISLADILRYSPYDHNYDLRSVGCDEQFFIDNIRVESANFLDEFIEFDKALTRNTSDHKPYIILSGYSGCGKTTLLHYLAKELHYKKGHAFSIINLTKNVGFGNEGLTLLRSTLEEDVYNILINSVQVIELILPHFSKIRNFRPDIDPNRAKLRQDLTNILSGYLLAQEENDFDNCYNDIRDFVSRISVTELLVYYILDKVMEFEKYLRNKYSSSSIEGESTESLVICFDNMDELSLQALTVEFWESFSDAKNAVDNISSKANIFMKGSSDRFMSIILTLRESNVALYSSQWEDRFGPQFLTRRFILDGDVSEIMERRAKFIRENKKYFEADASTQLHSLIEIFDTDKDWVRSRVLPLFNFDYRKYFEFMPSLLKRDSGIKSSHFSITYEEYLSLDNTNKTIARGVMYGYLIDFAFKTYFDRFLTRAEDGCNKYRMLLTIMFNIAYPKGLPENVIERNKKRPTRFTFKELLENADIFSESDVLKMAVDFFPLDESSFAQWIMIYDSNLFTLQNSNLNYGDIKRKKQSELNQDELKFVRLIEESFINFNASAFGYLRYIITHYEYFLYLVRKENPKIRIAPLALLTKLTYTDVKQGRNEQTNVPCYEFEQHINLVLAFVIKEKEAIEKFYEEHFLTDYSTEVEYSKSNYAFGENYTKKSFYITKFLFTHINYLDNFRYLAYYNYDFNFALDSERIRKVENTNNTQVIPLKSKDQIQDFIINIIEKYIDLCINIKYKDMRNEQTIYLMKESISSIRKLKNPKSGTYNFPPNSGNNTNLEWIWIRK